MISWPVGYIIECVNCNKTHTDKRKVIGGVLVFSSVILFANFFYAPKNPNDWRDALFLFFISSIAILIIGIYLLVTREPEDGPSKNKTELDPSEKADLRRWQLSIIVSFTSFWGLYVISIFDRNILLLTLAAACAWYGGIAQFRKRCPNCNHRLAHHGQLALWKHCAKCNIALK